MSRGEHSPNQRLLIFLHNIGAVVGKPGKTVEELAKIMEIKMEELEEIILSQINSGYLEYSTDEKGTRYYKLTGRGIIRVSSLYT
jgi:NCAIR mutase (PurE)-related protein